MKQTQRLCRGEHQLTREDEGRDFYLRLDCTLTGEVARHSFTYEALIEDPNSVHEWCESTMQEHLSPPYEQVL